MKRGERKLWQAVAESSAKVAASTNYAEEYIYGIEFARAMDALVVFGREGLEKATAVEKDAQVVAMWREAQ